MSAAGASNGSGIQQPGSPKGEGQPPPRASPTPGTFGGAPKAKQRLTGIEHCIPLHGMDSSGSASAAVLPSSDAPPMAHAVVTGVPHVSVEQLVAIVTSTFDSVSLNRPFADTFADDKCVARMDHIDAYVDRMQAVVHATVTSFRRATLNCVFDGDQKLTVPARVNALDLVETAIFEFLTNSLAPICEAVTDQRQKLNDARQLFDQTLEFVRPHLVPSQTLLIPCGICVKMCGSSFHDLFPGTTTCI
jgi:hypothetical protein